MIFAEPLRRFVAGCIGPSAAAPLHNDVAPWLRAAQHQGEYIREIRLMRGAAITSEGRTAGRSPEACALPSAKASTSVKSASSSEPAITSEGRTARRSPMMSRIRNARRRAPSLTPAVLFQPIPYRSALAEGATHTLVLRTRADGDKVTKEMSVVERMLMRRFFKARA